MESLVAEYYNEELADWGRVNRHRIEEVPEFEQRLTEIIRRDNIPSVAAPAEHFLQQFELLQRHFLDLQHEVEVQEVKFVKNNLPVDNKDLTEQVIVYQSVLRRKMFRVERDFLDAKYGCYEFISKIHHLQH